VCIDPVFLTGAKWPIFFTFSP